MGFSSTEYMNRHGRYASAPSVRHASTVGVMPGQRRSFGVNVDLDALDAIFDGLGEQLDEAIRPAAQAGADVLYRAVLRNVMSIGMVTGNLADSIYQVFSKDQSGSGKATYHVSWNARTAPHGHLVEFGHVQIYKVFLGKDGRWYTSKKVKLATPREVAAQPFVRPAMAFFPQAEQAVVTELLRRMQ